VQTVLTQQLVLLEQKGDIDQMVLTATGTTGAEGKIPEQRYHGSKRRCWNKMALTHKMVLLE
jgi:hypothetical protein